MLLITYHPNTVNTTGKVPLGAHAFKRFIVNLLVDVIIDSFEIMKFYLNSYFSNSDTIIDSIKNGRIRIKLIPMYDASC